MSDVEGLPEGSRVGPYVIRRLLGRGGMGAVYEADDTGMDRIVALKLMSGAYALDPEFKKRLQREARIAGRLHEPHVVPIHEAGEVDGLLFVDMRLIEGTDLATVLKQSGPMAPARAVAIVRQIACALDAAHVAGVIHRDVKPANILLNKDDFACLVDFGIANAVTEEQLTRIGDVMGTWTYMAPERFTGDTDIVTHSVDVYALTCVLYELLTGTPPYRGDHTSLMGAHLSAPVPKPSFQRQWIPHGLDAVIARGMAKNPKDRYPSAGELARAAEAALADRGNVSGDETSTIVASGSSAQAPTLPPGPPPAQWPQQSTPPPAQWPQQSTPPPAQWPQQSTPPPPQWPQQGTPPPTPPPATIPTTKRRRRWILVAAAIVLVVAVVGVFGILRLTSGNSTQGQSHSSSPSTPAVDISKLDVGHYGTKPRTLSGPTTQEEGRFLAAYALAEGMANPYEVDPKLDHLYGIATPDPKLAATTMAGTSTPIVQPVLEKYGMVSGYIVEAYSKPILEMQRAPSGEAQLVMLTSFPNPDAAGRAAAEMDAADFAVNPDNRHVTIPGYPQAKAHWRPGYSSVAATMARGRLVVSIVTSSTTAQGLNDLTPRVQRTFDMQGPLMDKVVVAVDAVLTSLPRDPDHMLSRAFVAGEQPTISAQYGTLGPRAVAFCADSEALKGRLFQQAGVDRCALTNDSGLLRAQDDAAALKLVQSDPMQNRDHDVAPPDGLPNARCDETQQKIWADNANDRFECLVSFGRYAATVTSNDENDVRQRAAAQYAILVNSA